MTASLGSLFNITSIWHRAQPTDPLIQNSSSDANAVRPLGSLSQPGGPSLRHAIRGLRNTIYGRYPWTKEDLEHRTKALYLRLSEATSFDEWRQAATELDAIEGNDQWKTEFHSTEYDPVLVQARLGQLEDARINHDARQMLFHIRTSLTRHLGGMGNLRLYQHSHIGTKSLIDRYIASALSTLSTLLDVTSRETRTGIDSKVLLEQVLGARQAFGRSALLLSGGGTLGMYHIGVVKALFEAQLLPRIISGSSAGSIVCAVLCARTDEEVPGVEEELLTGQLDVFTSVGKDDAPMQQIERLLKHGAVFDIGNLKRVMKSLLADITFQEAYNRTRRILNICVSSAGIYESPRLLNYVTAPNVVIWSAVAASCSVPGIFVGEQIVAKDPLTGEFGPWNDSPQKFIDGSVYNDLPMTRLAEMFNVNHFIVSQVNPHVIPFLTKEDDGVLLGTLGSKPTATLSGMSGTVRRLAGLARDEVMHRMQVMSELGILPNLMSKTRSVLSQRYSGDITILPEIPYSQFLQIMKNPSVEFIYNATAGGERATWPKLSRIQNHCAIELALDDAVQQLRARVAFSPSQVDLRLSAVGGPLTRAASETGRPDSSKGLGKRRKFKDRIPIGKKNHISRQTREPVSFQLASRDAPSLKVSESIDDDLTSDSDDADWRVGHVKQQVREPYTRQEFAVSTSALSPSTRMFPFASQPNTPSLRDARTRAFFSQNLTPAADSPQPITTDHPRVRASHRQSTSSSRSSPHHSRTPSSSGLSLTPGVSLKESESVPTRRSRSGRSTPKRLSWALHDDIVLPEDKPF